MNEEDMIVEDDVTEIEAPEEKSAPGAELPEAAEAAGAEEGDVVVSIGDEPVVAEEENRAPEWVRDLRKSNREKDRRIRELEQKVATAAPSQQTTAVGEKPTLEKCDYDTDKFEKDLEAWHARKREVEDQQRARTQTEEQQRTQWQARVTAVDAASSSLKIRDHDDAVLAFEDVFSPVQRGIVMGGPDDAKTSALLRYALGANPKKAKELAAISDPVKFTFAVAKLETQLKVANRKIAPAPDQPVRSSVAGAAAVDNQLERLRADAAKTGDMSKVVAYKNQKRSSARA